MVQRRGERTAARNERDFPDIIELQVPANGFGVLLDGMHSFYGECGIVAHRGRGKRRDNQDYVRRCFAKRSDAEAFEKVFGGKSISVR
jgi:hypothetical protein